MADRAARFEAEAELAGLADGRHDFAEFFRSPTGSLSLTIARWPAGSVDDQTPHTEDEVYLVLRGRARLVIGDEAEDVGPGSVAYVAAGVDHRFVDIRETIDVVVFWSPARHSNRPG